MNRLTKILLLGVGLCLAMPSCKKSDIKTLSEMKSEQKDAIKQFISERGISVKELKEEELPENIDSNVYYHFPNGLYMKILSKGEGQAEKDKTNVFLYADGFFFSKGDMTPTSSFHALSNGSYLPVEFTYTEYYSDGYQHFKLIPQGVYGLNFESLMCEGMAYPMKFLGDGARVSLIIPFEIGPTSYYNQGYTMMVEEARYSFN